MIQTRSIFDFQKHLFQELTQIGKEVYLDSKIFGLLTVICSHPPFITQTELSLITEWSATTISETLNQMLRSGLITTCKIPKSRKKGYKIISELFTVYELNYKRLFSQVEHAISIPPHIEEELNKLEKKYPKSPSVAFFGKYLTIFKQSGEEILKLASAISLSQTEELPLHDIEQLTTQLIMNFASKLTKSEIFLHRLQNELPSESSELFDQLNQLMQKYLEFFRHLMQQSERDVETGLILNTFFINYYPLTQDRLIELTEIPRTTISTNISSFIDKKVIFEIKGGESRKKYYHIAFPRELFMLFKQLHTLQVSIQMEKIISKIRSDFLKSYEQNLSEQITGFKSYLEQTELAYHRINYQSLRIVQKLADQFNLEK